MKLSKRQLRRIIREEYTRLKRRGLISEMKRPDDPDMIDPNDPRFSQGNVIDAMSQKVPDDMTMGEMGDVDDIVFIVDKCLKQSIPPKYCAQKLIKRGQILRMWDDVMQMWPDVAGAEAHLDYAFDVEEYLF